MAKTELTKELEECIIADIKQKHTGKKLIPSLKMRLDNYIERSLNAVKIDLQKDKRLVAIFAKPEAGCCKGKCK